jgi:hypothetical protein
MDKFFVTQRTANEITGPIMVTTSPRSTCPTACAFRKGGHGPLAGLCYAEHGALGGYVWGALDRADPGDTVLQGIRIYDFAELLYAVRSLPAGSLWRHNIAGDLLSHDKANIDRAALRALTEANKGRRGFTFTHYDVLTNLTNRGAIKEANRKRLPHQLERKFTRACRQACRPPHSSCHRNSPCGNEEEYDDAERQEGRYLPDEHARNHLRQLRSLCPHALHHHRLSRLRWNEAHHQMRTEMLEQIKELRFDELRELHRRLVL